MKKKVRIYKQGGEGKFINKTAQFLYKAQEGGTYDPNTMGYPGSYQQKQQQVQLDDNKLAAIVVQDISNSTPKEAIVMKLVTAYGKDPLQANQLVDQMYLYLEQESEKEKANAEDDDEYANTDVAPVVEPEVKPDRLNYDDDNDEGLAIAMEDEEVDDDDNEAAMNLIMRYGGLHKSQDGDAVNSELWNTENNQVEFPGIESYLPQSYVDMYGNTNESIAARAWQEPTETEEVVEDTSYTDPAVDPSTLKKGGTYKTNKRNFVKSILGLVKKQIGGEEETASSSPDPTGQDVRTNNLNSFLGILKNQSKLAIAEEEANQYFDEQQQTPMAEEGGDMENPMHHLQLYSDATKSIFSNPQNMEVRAQDGIEVGTNFQNLSNRQQRQLNRLYRSIGNNMPGTTPIYNNRAGVQLPQLGGYSVGPVTKFEVTRSGIFGNPRRYSMNFGPSSGQGIGMGSGINTGVGSTKATLIKSNKVIAANIINNVAIKEVATTTPTAATTTAATTEAEKQSSNFDLKKGIEADLYPNGRPGTTPVNAVTPSDTNPVVAPVDNSDIINNPEQKGSTISFDELQAGNADWRYTKDRPEADYALFNGKVYIQPDGDYTKPYIEITDPTRIANIKNFKKDQTLGYQALKGSPYEYYRDHLGNWQYLDEKAKTYFPVTNPKNLERLNKGENINNVYATLTDKPGYYYRLRNDGSYAKFKGDPKDHNSSKQSIDIITKKSNPKGWEYIENTGNFVDENNNNKKLSFLDPTKKKPVKKKEDNQNNTPGPWETLFFGNNVQDGIFDHFTPPPFPYAFGGSVNNLEYDEYGNLQKFVYGGDDEEQIDYNNSVDTTDPYFQRGGRVRAGLSNAMRSLGQLLPVNLPAYAGSYNKVGQAYDPSTGQLVNPRILGNELTEYKVTKSGLISGRPKKYTMYFNGAEKPVLPESGLNSDNNLNKALTVKETKELNLQQRNELARNPNINQGGDRWSRKDRRVENRMIRQANRKGFEIDPYDLTRFTDDEDKAIAPVVEYIEDSEREPDQVNAAPIPPASLNEEDYMDQRFRDEGLEPNTASVINNIVDLKPSIQPENVNTVLDNTVSSKPSINQEDVNTILDNIDQEDAYENEDVETVKTVEEIPEEDINDYIVNNDLSFNQPTMLDNQEDMALDNNAADYYQNSLNLEANAGPISTVENEPIRTYGQIENQAFEDSLNNYTNDYNPLRQDFDEQKAQKIRDNSFKYVEPTSLEDAFASYYNPYLETLNNQKLAGLPKKEVPKVKSKVVAKNPYSKNDEMYSVWNELSPAQKANILKQDSAVSKKIEDTKNKSIKEYKILKQDFTKQNASGNYTPADTKAAKDYYRKYVEPEIQAVVDVYANAISKLEKNNTAENKKSIAKLIENREQDIKRKNNEFYEQAGYNVVGDDFIRKPSDAQATKFREWLNKYHKKEAKSFDLSLTGSANSSSFQNAWKDWGTTFLYKYELGGSLNKFLPKAENGDESPIAYPKPGPEEEDEFDNMLKTFGAPIADDPKLDVPTPPQKEAWDTQDLPFTGPVGAYDPRIEDVETYDKRVDKNDPFALDVKVKNQFEVDNEALLQAGNAGVEGVLGAIDKRQNLKRERPMYDNLSADNLYAAKTTKDRGDYVASGSGTGLFRPDEQGQVWNSRSKQYGGENYEPDYSSIENNIYESTFEDGGFYEDDETYMTQDQIDQYLAAGGEIEYI